MSVINTTLKHVFIHVPKTAGTSMERLATVGGNGHEAAKQLLAKAPDDYFSWGFVRNPFDRIVSAYHSLRTNPHHHTPDVDELSFDQWVASGAQSKSTLFWSYAHTLPMTHYLCDNDNFVLVDFVGRFENLIRDWGLVNKHIGVKKQPLAMINVAEKRAHWSALVTNKKTKLNIQHIYKDDFSIFAYDLEPQSNFQ